MAAKNAIARRRKGPSPQIAKMGKQLTSTRGRLTALKRNYEASRVPQALINAGANLGGAVAGQILEEFVGDDVLGVPTSVGAGLLTVGGGLALKQPWMIHAGTGAMVPYIADYARDKVAQWRDRSNDNSDSIGPKAVTGGE